MNILKLIFVTAAGSILALALLWVSLLAGLPSFCYRAC
jgi:hypothetical protein